MQISGVDLPSNRKFGFFVTLICIMITVYTVLNHDQVWGSLFALLSMMFLLLTLINSKLLQTLNIGWMCLGLVLGKIITPIVMGLIFFVFFTPIAVLMRLSGRDELKLRFKKQQTYWQKREEPTQAISFENQF